MVLKFLWKGNNKIKYEVIIQKEKMGGLGLIDLETKIRSIQLSWVPKLCYGTGNWRIIPCHYFKTKDLVEIFHQRLIEKTPSMFYNSMVTNWKKIHNAPLNRE